MLSNKLANHIKLYFLNCTVMTMGRAKQASNKIYNNSNSHSKKRVQYVVIKLNTLSSTNKCVSSKNCIVVSDNNKFKP